MDLQTGSDCKDRCPDIGICDHQLVLAVRWKKSISHSPQWASNKNLLGTLSILSICVASTFRFPTCPEDTLACKSFNKSWLVFEASAAKFIVIWQSTLPLLRISQKTCPSLQENSLLFSLYFFFLLKSTTTEVETYESVLVLVNEYRHAIDNREYVKSPFPPPPPSSLCRS